MSHYAVIEGYNAAIIVTTIAEELSAVSPELHTQTLKTICLSGGAMCLNVTQQYLDYVLGSELVTPEAKQVMAAYKPVPTVVLYEDFFTEMSKEESEAVMWHEVGHIVNSHHLQPANEGLFSVVLENEVTADAFAAEKVSKEAMSSALHKLFRATAKQIAPIAVNRGKEFDEEEYYQEVIAEPAIQARFAALQ